MNDIASPPPNSQSQISPLSSEIEQSLAPHLLIPPRQISNPPPAPLIPNPYTEPPPGLEQTETSMPFDKITPENTQTPSNNLNPASETLISDQSLSSSKLPEELAHPDNIPQSSSLSQQNPLQTFELELLSRARAALLLARVTKKKRHDQRLQRIITYITTNGPSSSRDLQLHIHMSAMTIWRYTKELMSQGRLQCSGIRRNRLYFIP